MALRTDGSGSLAGGYSFREEEDEIWLTARVRPDREGGEKDCPT